MLPVHTCSSSRRPAEAPSAAHTMPGALAARTLGWQQMRAHQYVRRHAAAVPLFGHRVGARGQGQVELRIKGERERPRACAALHLAVESGSGVEGAKADASPARARQRAETAVARSMVGRESAAVGGAAGGRAWRVCARACVRECVGANAACEGAWPRRIAANKGSGSSGSHTHTQTRHWHADPIDPLASCRAEAPSAHLRGAALVCIVTGKRETTRFCVKTQF